MNFNKYNEVINGDMTYKKIASELLKLFSTGIGWTDEEGTHLDIIFKLGMESKFGDFQRGIRKNYLFISIIDHTSYGFISTTIKDVGYIQEKLRMNDICGKKVAELINGIIQELNKNRY